MGRRRMAVVSDVVEDFLDFEENFGRMGVTDGCHFNGQIFDIVVIRMPTVFSTRVQQMECFARKDFLAIPVALSLLFLVNAEIDDGTRLLVLRNDR